MQESYQSCSVRFRFWNWSLLTAHHWSYLSQFLSLTYHVNTLVCTILTPGNQMSLPTMLLSGWPKFAYVANSCPTRDETHDLQTALTTTLMLPFFLYLRYSTHKVHLRTLRLAILFVTSCFFLLVVLFTQFHCHISSLLFTCFFLSSCGRLLNLHKHWLFCLQHATHCLLEWWTLVGSSETAVCGFCLSISLQKSSISDPNVFEFYSMTYQPLGIISWSLVNEFCLVAHQLLWVI